MPHYLRRFDNETAIFIINGEYILLGFDLIGSFSKFNN